jgi:hypothetical protein
MFVGRLTLTLLAKASGPKGDEQILKVETVGGAY